jgi:hypothetical protein
LPVKVDQGMGQNGDGVRILAERYSSLRRTEGPKNLPVAVAVVPDRETLRNRDITQ